MRIDYEKNLNPAQYEAVCTTDGPVLVIAGAGSGKTRTLTYRVARLVEQGAYPDSILLLTFTRKAADQMLARASELLDERINVSGGTFHSFSHLLLRRYADRLGYSPNFAVLDRSDCESVVGASTDKVMPKRPARGFPKKSTIADIISAAANKSRDVYDIIESDHGHFSRFSEEISAIAKGYHALKREQNLMDFDDLLLLARTLLASDSEVRERVTNRYSHIMVDEYQDTNKVQAELLELLGTGHQNVMAVGDDCQSIYGFRGADFENIMRFPKVFAGTRLIRLEENYRSTAPILDLANQVSAQARIKYEKHLFTRASGGDKPVLASLRSERDQSVYVVDEIRRLVRQGSPLKEIAVLFRAGFHSFDLEVELSRAGFAFAKYGGFKFMESGHVKDLLAHLRVLAFPGDRVSWTRILSLLDHVGQKTAAALAAEIDQKGMAAIKPKPSWADGWNRLYGALSGLDPKNLSVAAMGEALFEYYDPVMRGLYDNWPKRAKDLEQLVLMMERYGSDLVRFLSDMALEPPTTSEDGGLSVEGESKTFDRLTLSTIHSAKGLEWDNVFVIWVTDGRFPPMQAANRGREALEEEIRLLYVASTRARKSLIFTHPTDVFDPISGSYLDEPCRFLCELSKKTLSRERL